MLCVFSSAICNWLICSRVSMAFQCLWPSAMIYNIFVNIDSVHWYQKHWWLPALHCIGCSYLPTILFSFTIFTMLKTAVLCFVDIVPDVVEQQAERSRKDSRWMGPLPLQHDFIYILIILWFLTFVYLWHPKTLVPNKCQVNIARRHLADLSGSWGTLFVWAGLTKLRTCDVLIQSYLTQVSVCK